MDARGAVSAASRLLAVLGASAGGVVTLHRLGERPYFHIDWSDLGGWLAVTAPEDVLVAGVRVLALVVAWWVLGTTLLYVAARATRLPGTLRAVEWATLPAVRRLADRAVAVTLAGSSALAAAGPAVAAHRDPPAVMPPAVVMELDAPDNQGSDGAAHATEGYVPTPAGEQPWGEATSAGEPGFRLPLPEAPAPVSPPPATALPPEREYGEQDREASAPLETWPDDEAQLDAASRRALPGAGATAGPSASAAADERSTGAGEHDPATGSSAYARGADGERDPSALPSSHTVAPGDHLWGIAERTLTAAWGRPPSPGELVGYWQQLMAANTDRLASGDPDLIFPGEVIDLPAIPSRKE